MATITVPDVRSYPLAVVSTFTFEDVVGVVAVALFAIQPGSLVNYLKLIINTTFAGGTTHDCDIGDATTADRYNGTIIELDGTAGVNPANPPLVGGAANGFLTTSTQPSILMTPTSTGGDPTSGSASLYATYISTGRAHENYEI